MNIYEELGVHENDDIKKIRKVYIELAKKYHPDKFVDPAQKAFAERKMKAINLAYDILRDVKNRKEYDETLRNARHQEDLMKRTAHMWAERTESNASNLDKYGARDTFDTMQEEEKKEAKAKRKLMLGHVVKILTLMAFLVALSYDKGNIHSKGQMNWNLFLILTPISLIIYLSVDAFKDYYENLSKK